MAVNGYEDYYHLVFEVQVQSIVNILLLAPG